MRYVLARYKQELRDRAYRLYITESIYAKGEDKRLTIHYSDMIKRQPRNQDRRTGDEIALDVIQRLGLRVEE